MRILVLAKDDETANMLAGLRQDGHDVTIVRSIEQANLDEINAVIVDPAVENGLAFLSRVPDTNIRIVILTTSLHNPLSMSQWGVDAVLQRPTLAIVKAHLELARRQRQAP